MGAIHLQAVQEASRWREVSAPTRDAAWLAGPSSSTSSGWPCGRSPVAPARRCWSPQGRDRQIRLVTEGLDAAVDAGFQAFQGAADELDQRRPFGAISDCLGLGYRATDGRRAAVARLLTEDQGCRHRWGWFGDTPQAEFRVVEAVVALVEDLSARSPVMVAVEDLQWVDPSTLLVMHRLGRQVRQLPVLLVCTARPVPRSQELERCLQGLRAGGAAELVLGPLDAAAVARLVERLVDAAPGPSLRRLVVGAGGNTDATLRLCLVQTLLVRGRLEEALRQADTDRLRFQAFKASALASVDSWRRRRRPPPRSGRWPRSWATSWPGASAWPPWPWSAACGGTSGRP
jgi:hypothetical protein